MQNLLFRRQFRGLYAVFGINVDLVRDIGYALNHFFRRVISEYPSHRRIYRDESSLRCRLEHSFHGVFENRSVILFGLLNLCVKRSALERGGRGARENRQRFHLAERERARAIERVDVDGAD